MERQSFRAVNLFVCLAFLFALLMLSLSPLLVKLGANPERKPLEFLEWAEKVDFTNYKWSYISCGVYHNLGETKRALAECKKSLKLNALNPDAWRVLADVYTDMGKDEKAIKALSNAAYLYPLSRFNQWEVLVRALSMKSDEAAELARSQIYTLIYLSPQRKFFDIAFMIDGEQMKDHLPQIPVVWKGYLGWLVSAGKFDEIYDVWKEMELRHWSDERSLRIAVEGLLRGKRYDEAWLIWRKYFGDSPIYNGGFEKDFANFGFGWRWNPRIKGLKAWGFSRERVEGIRSFYMEFDGEHNPYVFYPRQLVYIPGPGRYRVSAFVKAEEVTSASGFALEVWGKGVRARSREVKGDTPWKLLKVEFEAEKKGVVWLAFVRRATDKLNRFLGGKIWIDEVELERCDEQKIAERSTH